MHPRWNKRPTNNDFDAQEITSVVKSAYAHTAEHPGHSGAEKGSKRVKSSVVPLTQQQSRWRRERKRLWIGILRANTTFQYTVFYSFPDFLYAGLKYVFDKRERDTLLLVMITVISSLLHTVTAYYARKRYR